MALPSDALVNLIGLKRTLYRGIIIRLGYSMQPVAAGFAKVKSNAPPKSLCKFARNIYFTF